MNAKKAGLVAAGVLAAGVIAAPAAWAFGADAGPDCTYQAQGEDGVAQSVVTDDNPLNTLLQAPVAGGQEGEFGHCSTYGQNNNQGNGEGNTFNGQEFPAPSAPAFPSFPAFPGLPN